LLALRRITLSDVSSGLLPH